VQKRGRGGGKKDEKVRDRWGEREIARVGCRFFQAWRPASKAGTLRKGEERRYGSKTGGSTSEGCAQCERGMKQNLLGNPPSPLGVCVKNQRQVCKGGGGYTAFMREGKVFGRSP